MTRFCMVFLLVAVIAGLTASPATAGLGLGLELHSPMDGITPWAYNGYWEDVSGNDYHVRDNAAPAYDGGGARSTAVECSTSGDSVMPLINGYDSALDPGLDDYSVSCWAHQSDPLIGWAMSKGAYDTGVTPGFALLSINGTPSFRVLGVGGGSAEQLTLQQSGGSLTGGWHHLVGVIDRTGATGAANTASFYVDGTLAQSGAIPDVGGSPADISFPGEDLLIGGRGKTGYAFGGYVDDLALYRGALSSTDVQTLHGASGLDASTITSPGISPLVIQNFETMGGGTVLGIVPDVVAGNDGLPTPPAVEITDATRGQVIDFGGSINAKVDYDYGDLGDPMAQSQTVAFWFKMGGGGELTQHIANKGNYGSTDPGWSVFLVDDDTDTIYVRGNCEGTLGTEKASVHKPIVEGAWHHLALVIDNTGGVLKGYLDGQGSGAAGGDNGWTAGGGGPDVATFTAGSTFDSGSCLRLGMSPNGNMSFNGLVDDFAIWDRVLSDAEILSIYNGAEIGGSEDLLPGDADGSGTVDHLDAAIVAANWLQEGNWYDGDFNEDGIVDDMDATMMAANWLMSNSAGASVPEPGMIAMVIAGLIACFAGRCLGGNKRSR